MPTIGYSINTEEDTLIKQLEQEGISIDDLEDYAQGNNQDAIDRIDSIKDSLPIELQSVIIKYFTPIEKRKQDAFTGDDDNLQYFQGDFTVKMKDQSPVGTESGIYKSVASSELKFIGIKTVDSLIKTAKKEKRIYPVV